MSWFSDVLRSPSHVSISSRFTLFPYTTLFRSPRAKVLQLGTVFRLDAEMVEAVLHCPGGNREVDARIIELPLCVVVFLYRGLSRKQRGVKTNALLQIMHGDVHVKSFHVVLLSSWAVGKKPGRTSGRRSSCR